MHELAVCQALIAQIETIAAQHKASAVEKVVLHIGPLSGIESQLLLQAYPIASADSIANDAQLVIEELPIRVRCEQCGAETEAIANKLICGQCGDWHAQVISGDEMLLASLELRNNEELGD